MSATLKPGTKVILNVPENPRLHHKQAIIKEVTDWGAHVYTHVAATGNFRALHEEMIIQGSEPSSRDAGYTGDICGQCQGVKMRRNGSCLLCEDCGSTSGCS